MVPIFESEPSNLVRNRAGSRSGAGQEFPSVILLLSRVPGSQLPITRLVVERVSGGKDAAVIAPVVVVALAAATLTVLLRASTGASRGGSRWNCRTTAPKPS